MVSVAYEFPCTVGDFQCVLSQLPKKGYFRWRQMENRFGEFPEVVMRLPTYYDRFNFPGDTAVWGRCTLGLNAFKEFTHPVRRYRFDIHKLIDHRKQSSVGRI